MTDQIHSHAKEVWSNQEGPFKDLEKLVRKYACTPYLRPIADHTRRAFADAEQFIADFYSKHQYASSQSAPLPVILDSGCGTGESTLHLAHQFPGYPIIGIDKSAVRLDKAARAFDTGESHVADTLTEAPQQITPKNIFYVRAELIDFWRLALNKVTSRQWVIPYHSLYYPNPWPKQSEAGRRFHLHPIFPTLLQLAQETELRTNWEIYAQEFAQAARLLLPDANIATQQLPADNPITAFERKYKNAGQTLWRVTVKP